MSTIEARFAARLSPLVDGRAFPDTVPPGVEFPLFVYQQVGGRTLQYLDGSVPVTQHARIQVIAWALRRAEANDLIRQAHASLASSTILTVEAYGAPTWMYEEALGLYGARQDFGVWGTVLTE